MAYICSGNHRHVAQPGSKIEIGLAALTHEGYRVLRFSGVGGPRISVEQVGYPGLRNQTVDKSDERTAQRIAQVEVYQLVIDVTVQHNDLNSAPPAFARNHKAEMNCVQQVEKMTGQG